MTTDPGAVPRDALPLLDDEEEVNYDPTSSKIGQHRMYVCMYVHVCMYVCTYMYVRIYCMYMYVRIYCMYMYT